MKFDPLKHDRIAVVIPQEATWDKLTALVLHVALVLKKQMRDVTVRFQDEFRGSKGDPDLAAIPDNLYDIDVRVQYTEPTVWRYLCTGSIPKDKDTELTRKCNNWLPAAESDAQTRTCPACTFEMTKLFVPEFGSATEALINQEGIKSMPGVTRLGQLMSLNNAPGAILKYGFDESLVKLLREVYDLPSESSYLERRRAMLEMFAPIVLHYLEAAKLDGRTVIKLSNPFCMAQYRAVLAILGYSNPEIDTFVAPYYKIAEEVTVRQDAAKRAARTIGFTAFEIPGKNPDHPAEGRVIHTDDRLITRHYIGVHRSASPRLSLVVNRTTSGNVAIQTRGEWNLVSLFGVLDDEEPTLWRLEGRYPSQMVLNGSATRAKPPTKFTDEELIALIGRVCEAPLPRKKPRDQRRRQYYRTTIRQEG